MPSETCAQAYVPGKLNNGQTTKYGLGWEIDSPDVVEHWGEWEGFAAHVRRELVDLVETGIDDGAAKPLIAKITDHEIIRFRVGELRILEVDPAHPETFQPQALHQMAPDEPTGSTDECSLLADRHFLHPSRAFVSCSARHAYAQPSSGSQVDRFPMPNLSVYIAGTTPIVRATPRISQQIAGHLADKSEDFSFTTLLTASFDVMPHRPSGRPPTLLSPVDPTGGIGRGGRPFAPEAPSASRS